MKTTYKISCALTVLTLALAGCAGKTIKVEEVKPNPLPKIAVTQSLTPVFSTSVSSTPKADPLRLRLAVDQGVIFSVNPKGQVAAFRGKQRLWETSVTKNDLTSGVTAADGIVVVGSRKGELFALDQATGKLLWTKQLTGSILAPSLIQAGRVVTLTNDGLVYAHQKANGTQSWTYNLPNVQFSLRGTAAPIALDPRTVLVASANAYVYAIDIVTGAPRIQRRVAVSDGRSDIERLNDIDGDPVVAGQYLVTTSYQGQVTVLDLVSQQVVWSEDSSSLVSPAVTPMAVYVSQANGELVAHELSTGRIIWKNSQLLNRKLSNPVILGGQLVVGDLDGVLHLVDPNSGEFTGRATTSGEVRTLNVFENQLYVGTSKGAFSIWQNR